jgi:ABC-type xylose transport system permease subunit
MIDWYNLAANSLWILAMALALATLSYARWEARERQERLRITLSRSALQVKLNFSGALFCLGLASTSRALGERVLWLFLMVLFLIQVWLSRKAGQGTD